MGKKEHFSDELSVMPFSESFVNGMEGVYFASACARLANETIVYFIWLRFFGVYTLVKELLFFFQGFPFQSYQLAFLLVLVKHLQRSLRQIPPSQIVKSQMRVVMITMKIGFQDQKKLEDETK